MTKKQNLLASILLLILMIAVGGFLSYFGGRYISEVVGTYIPTPNYMPPGEHNTINEFLMPVVYSVLFMLPFVLVARLFGGGNADVSQSKEQ